jgi:hypothetical protein
MELGDGPVDAGGETEVVCVEDEAGRHGGLCGVRGRYRAGETPNSHNVRPFPTWSDRVVRPLEMSV